MWAAHVVEVASASGHCLLNAVDHVSRHVQAILDVDVHTAEPHDDAQEPEEERGAGAVRAGDDSAGAVENTGAFGAGLSVSSS